MQSQVLAPVNQCRAAALQAARVAGTAVPHGQMQHKWILRVRSETKRDGDSLHSVFPKQKIPPGQYEESKPGK